MQTSRSRVHSLTTSSLGLSRSGPPPPCPITAGPGARDLGQTHKPWSPLTLFKLASPEPVSGETQEDGYRERQEDTGCHGRATVHGT